MTDGRLTFESHGARIAVCAEPAELIARVHDVLPPGARLARFEEPDTTLRLVAHDGAGDGAVIDMDGNVLLRDVAVDRALRSLANVFHYGVASHARTHLFLHAGVVQWQGRAILLPGESRSGKSTLVDALLHAGASYYSDECAPIGADGRVHPYRKPLRLRKDRRTSRWRGAGHRAANRATNGRLSVTSRRHVGGDDGPTDGPLEIGMVLLAQYREDGEWSPRRLTPGQAVLCMAAHGVRAASLPDATLSVLTRIAAHAPTFVTDRGEAAGVAARVLALMDDAPDVPFLDVVTGRDLDLSSFF